MNKEQRLLEQMTIYEQGQPQRTQHFLKVYAFAQAIATMEQLAEDVKETLLAAALVHDCGIKPSLEKYGSCGGEYQQIEGPVVAEGLLRTVGYGEAMTRRVCYLVAHHHTYHGIDGLDYQILVEADFLVNIFESDMTRSAVEEILTNIFRTTSGKQLLCRMYLHE